MPSNGLLQVFQTLKKSYLKNFIILISIPSIELISESLNYLDLESCSPVSSFNSVSKALYLFLFVIMGMIALFFFIAAILNQQNRINYFSKGMVFALSFLLFFPTNQLSYVIRYNEMTKTAEIAAPVIQAIEQFKDDNKKYPVSLNNLVPSYLQKIPHTGMCAYPHFEYRDTKDGSYELFISTSIGALNWDEFIYRPSGNYGVSFKKLGSWGYYHE